MTTLLTVAARLKNNPSNWKQYQLQALQIANDREGRSAIAQATSAQSLYDILLLAHKLEDEPDDIIGTAIDTAVGIATGIALTSFLS